MAFQLQRSGSDVHVTVDSQLVVENRQHLKHALLDAIETGARHFTIDFRGTGYIDASGLGVLVSIQKKIHEEGGTVDLVNLNDDLVALFDLAKLDTVFTIEGKPPITSAEKRAQINAREHERLFGQYPVGARAE